jgi:V/A-type H+-transporting ATPase subunit D
MTIRETTGAVRKAEEQADKIIDEGKEGEKGAVVRALEERKRILAAARMELLRLRRRLGLARRGHRLLRGKKDELLRRFMVLLKEYTGMSGELLSRTIGLVRLSGEVGLNLEEPVFDVHLPDRKPPIGASPPPVSYGHLARSWREALPRLVKTAEKKEVLTLLAEEIERTRQRVNTLEYKLIPGLEDRIRVVILKMSENELGNFARLMRIKEVVEGSGRPGGRESGVSSYQRVAVGRAPGRAPGASWSLYPVGGPALRHSFRHGLLRAEGHSPRAGERTRDGVPRTLRSRQGNSY